MSMRGILLAVVIAALLCAAFADELGRKSKTLPKPKACRVAGYARGKCYAKTLIRQRCRGLRSIASKDCPSGSLCCAKKTPARPKPKPKPKPKTKPAGGKKPVYCYSRGYAKGHCVLARSRATCVKNGGKQVKSAQPCGSGRICCAKKVDKNVKLPKKPTKLSGCAVKGFPKGYCVPTAVATSACPSQANLRLVRTRSCGKGSECCVANAKKTAGTAGAKCQPKGFTPGTCMSLETAKTKCTTNGFAYIRDDKSCRGKTVCCARVAANKKKVDLPGVYGNWCGPGHSGGKTTAAPIDDLDAACMRHDRCYGDKGYFDCSCDSGLVKEIKDIDNLDGKAKSRAAWIKRIFSKTVCFKTIKVPCGLSKCKMCSKFKLKYPCCSVKKCNLDVPWNNML